MRISAIIADYADLYVTWQVDGEYEDWVEVLKIAYQMGEDD